MPPKTTPMLRQYLSLKEKYQDCILFYRMGDFYEMFFDDAKVASRALEIALTSRNKNDEDPIPMCGVPHHAAKAYLARLIESGFKVAICEQVEDPKEAKGLVKREVIQVVTAATLTDPDFLEPKENNYLAAADPRPGGSGSKGLGLAFMDLSTGDFQVRETDSLISLAAEIGRLKPAELLLPASFLKRDEYKTLAAEASLGQGGAVHVEPVEDRLFDRRRAVDLVLGHFKVSHLGALGIDELSSGLPPAGAVLAYAHQTRQADLGHVVELRVEKPQSFMQMDETTYRHLELFFTLPGKRGKGTLIQVLDKTQTAMGGRLLRRWLANPLTDLKAIIRRQEAVTGFYRVRTEREELREHLSRVADLERLCGRVVMNQAQPREMVQLKTSIHSLGPVMDTVLKIGHPALTALVQEMDPLSDVALDIGRTVLDDPAPALKEGGIIKSGHNQELDELNHIRSHSQDYILSLEEREKKRTGVSSLKVKFNKVFGYYIELSKANLDKVPEEYQRKQTLVNHERYTTTELAEYEEKALTAGAAAAELEYRLFTELRQRVAAQARRIQTTAALVARLDCLAGLAQTAKANDYHRPARSTEQGIISLTGSRHPVVERVFPGRALCAQRPAPGHGRAPGPDPDRAQHGRQVHHPPSGGPGPDNGPDGRVRSGQERRSVHRGPPFHPGGGRGRVGPGPVHLHGGDVGDGPDPQPGHALLPGPPGRDRPGHFHL